MLPGLEPNTEVTIAALRTAADQFERINEALNIMDEASMPSMCAIKSLSHHSQILPPLHLSINRNTATFQQRLSMFRRVRGG